MSFFWGGRETPQCDVSTFPSPSLSRRERDWGFCGWDLWALGLGCGPWGVAFWRWALT